jgi:tRNA(Ile)-lysidine synthase
VRLLVHIRQHELLKAGDRVGVAVSGGIDSVALLRLLLECRHELGIVVSVVHFNHNLRGTESDADQQFVERLADEQRLELICDSDDVAGHAREQGVSLETAARELRYGFFRHLIKASFSDPQFKPSTLSQTARQGRGIPLGKILTGHTLDDQAETVLMRLIRGTGLRGIGGIYPRIPVEGDDGEICGEVVRPLLRSRRSELEQYLRDIGQSWREDATNADESFTRNRVRKLLVPLLEKEFNPSIAASLSELAEIARGEEDYWQNEVSGWMGTGVHWLRPEWAEKELTPPALIQISGSSTETLQTDEGLQVKISNAPWLVMNASVDRIWFSGEPIAVQRRIVKAVGDEAGIPLEFKHVEEVLRFASNEDGTGKELSLPLGWKLVRHLDELLFKTPDLRSVTPSHGYEYSLPIPGRVDVREAGFTIEARRVSAEEAAEYNPDELLDVDSVTGLLVVRNWRAGDRFWPAHTKSPKKIKELLQERHVAQPDRESWPVIVNGDEIIWVRRFPAPTKYRARVAQAAVAIVETALRVGSAT